jgi:hypothetical protein
MLVLVSALLFGSLLCLVIGTLMWLWFSVYFYLNKDKKEC